MFILKHLKICFDLIEIIFRELIYSLLKSLILKLLKNVTFLTNFKIRDFNKEYMSSLKMS